MARARCLCGDLVWEVEGPLFFVHDCHCSRCRKSSGAACVRLAGVANERFRWVQGGDALGRYLDAPGGIERTFCRRCGSSAPGGDFGDTTFFPLGALEGEIEVPPSDGHIFVASKAPWYEITDGRPTFDAYPPGLELTVLPDVERHAPPGRTGGSCLCGAVAWEFDGDPDVMRYCHCLRCRRARQASHAANARVAREKLHWIAGDDHAVLFALPDAERFSQAFCPDCGGKTPWLIEGLDAWNVPLGNLDDDPGPRPREHIFVGSKAPWFEITDALPQHEEYSP